MPFEIRVEFPQCEQLLTRDDPRLGPCGVQDRRRMPLGENEAIVVLVARIRAVVAHLGEEEGRHQFGHGTARAGMTRTCFTGREHRIDAQTRSNVLQRRYARGRLDWQGRTSGKAHYNDLMLALRYVYLLALVVWLGGMVVLGAVVAPTTFQVLQAAAPATGRALAGELFGVTLARFHYLAYGAGGVLFITLALMAILGPRPAGFAIRLGIIVVMLGVAGYFGIRGPGGINPV